MWKVEIVAAPALELAGVAYRGPYAEIGGAFGQLHEILTAKSLYRDGQHLSLIHISEPTRPY